MQGNRPLREKADAQAVSYSRWRDLAILVKMRLSLLVVFSALLAYAIVAGGDFSLTAFVILGLGGFCITAAANGLNQALEKDYDRLMTRTADRPVATGRMTMSEAVLVSGLLFVVGIGMLTMFNPLAASLGACAVVSYAFLYTPLKRVSPFSVFVGAIPGALPTMIAVVAYEGRFTLMAFVLFGIQFFWQFAHFWSIGFLGFEDYRRAGYRLVPELDGKVHPKLGWQSTIFCMLLLPVVAMPYWLGTVSWPATILVELFTLGYTAYAWRFHVHKDQMTARQLMFASFAYLPLVLVTLYLGS